jgi:hypothetical protein
MRIALLFSGQPRSVDGIIFKSIQDTLLSQYNVDVYAHFWEYSEPGKSTSSCLENIEKFKSQYSPKALAIDPPLLESEYPSGLNTNWMKNSYSMYTSMKRVYSLFESKSKDIEYSWIIRIRVDSILYRVPDLTTLPTNRIYVPDWHKNAKVVVNHMVILSPNLAKMFFSIQDTFQQLKGTIDEEYVYSHLELHNQLQFLQPLDIAIFFPTISRDGITKETPPPNGHDRFRVTELIQDNSHRVFTRLKRFF